jgi:hypothetical protein
MILKIITKSLLCSDMFRWQLQPSSGKVPAYKVMVMVVAATETCRNIEYVIFQ